MSLIPEDLKYTKTHEWVRVEGNEAIVGITDFAQGELSDVVYVELDCLGKSLKQGDTLATVEAVKAVSDVYSPVSGEVVAVNKELLQSAPETVNKDPYGKGWMARILMSSPQELDGLLGPKDYEQLAASSKH
ncbi:MAG: glycine cleavage system protein GcvH [candidate division WOR-3 bacterium]